MLKLDFVSPRRKKTKSGITIYPEFTSTEDIKDLMIRGGTFYAVWDPINNIWSTKKNRVFQLIDQMIDDYICDQKEHGKLTDDQLSGINVTYCANFSDGIPDKFDKYCKSRMDSFELLDNKVIFADEVPIREDYASKKLPYALDKEGSCPNYDRLMSRLYSQEERDKIEWAVGAVLSGDAADIQKFIVLYGDPGAGKSTVLHIIENIFGGQAIGRKKPYWTTFDAKSLTSSRDSFSTEVFKNNPIVAIQHDGDLSRIEDNTKLNSIASHEKMTINEKHKSQYTMQVNTFMFLGSNSMVKISDSKSGLIRRLIDVHPTGNLFDIDEYNKIIFGVSKETPAIAWRCMQVYNKLGMNYYTKYKPMDMMYGTDVLFNFVDEYYDYFKTENIILGKDAFAMYKNYCDDTNQKYVMTYQQFREQFRDYFYEFYERTMVNGQQRRQVFVGLKTEKFNRVVLKAKSNKPKEVPMLVLDKTESQLDYILKDCPAQYANADEFPCKKWDEVETTLKDLDTSKIHYIRPPDNLIVIDFDLKDKDGNKSKELNLKAAALWPKTYAEFSKGGGGVHLHYYYDGDVSRLNQLYSENIEVKVFTGKSSLRRKLSYCNDESIIFIDPDKLPLKEGKKTNKQAIQDEQHLRACIEKALRKEVGSGSTKPSIDYIYTVLEEYYATGKPYSVIDLRPKIHAFAANSSHQADYCLKMVNKMKFESENIDEHSEFEFDKIIFYDVEVFPNLFLVNWKLEGPDNPVVRMINPSPTEIGDLFKYKLVGFNNRRYDNHIMYARYIGYTNLELYDLSQRLVSNSRNGTFAEAYNLSYTDIYDYCAVKQSLKKWEIQLGIHHEELGLPWDQPVDESLWTKVAEYCDNDVIATEAVWNATQADFTARKILAELADKTPNDSTNSLTTAIIFGKEKKPALVYTDLATGLASDPEYQRTDIISAFPGYEFVRGDDGKYRNMYMGTDLGMGGYVYAEPGMYKNVALLDVASLHPHSTLAMNCFGKYTKNYADIIKTRICIKHKDYDTAKTLFGGKLAKYLDDPAMAKQLSQALKIAINSVYGLTSATFDSPFRDVRNKNNIVALRGALFMRTLQEEVNKRGFTVAHIKTDSIKIPDATPEIISFCMEFAKKYGYEFEHEATYEKMCLVNDAVYIAKYKDGEHAGEWTATGTQFAVPYVFKTLFSKEPIIFEDLCETKSVTTALYLDFNENLPEGEHDYHFVGKVGLFCPIISGKGGGILVREKDGKYNSATGAKGYRWKESEVVKKLGLQDEIDMFYYRKLANDAIDNISKYGDFEWLVDDYISEEAKDDKPPFDGPYITTNNN